jgi:hypothetical protein
VDRKEKKSKISGQKGLKIRKHGAKKSILMNPPRGATAGDVLQISGEDFLAPDIC